MTSYLTINGKPYSMKDWSSCLAWLKELQPTTLVLCIDQPDQTGRILEAKDTLPNTKIVARFIDEIHDGSMHLKPQTTPDYYIVSPRNQLNRIKVLGQNGLSAYWGNEPDTKGSADDLNRLIDHTIEAMDLAASRDYDMSLTVFNFGIGHPKPVDGMLPVWINRGLLKINEHRNRHYYGLHLYLPMDTLEHLKALKKTCDFLRIPVPRIMITEFGYDSDGTSSLRGFKTRDKSNEQFADVCIDTLNGDLKAFLESEEVQGVAIFIYGDDNWWDFNVETANKGEVSTAWCDAILNAAKAGKLDFKKSGAEVLQLPITRKDIKAGATYRLNTSGKIIDVYAAPSTSDRHIGTIADNAEIEAGNTASIQGQRWLQIYTPTFKLGGWIEGDLIGLRQTIETSVVTPPPSPTPQVMTPAQVAHLEAWSKELAETIQIYTDRKALVDKWIQIAKETTA